MKNILSSLNESEKKRILEMHYRASGRHYLMEATNADYNVIKTAVDSTYKETLNKYLMAGVSLIDPVDGKPTKIQFNPLDPSQIMSTYSQIGGQDYDRGIGNPTYTCGGTVLDGSVDAAGKPSVSYWDGHLAAQEFYSQSIGAQGDQPRAAARNELTNELGKVAVSACKAIDALSKGLPNPLIKVTTTTKPQASTTAPAKKAPAQTTVTSASAFKQKLESVVSQLYSDYFSFGYLEGSTEKEAIFQVYPKSNNTYYFEKVGDVNKSGLYYCKRGWDTGNPFETNIILKYKSVNSSMNTAEKGLSVSAAADKLVKAACSKLGQ